MKLEKLKELYGFDRADQKWNPKGACFAEYVGSQVLYIKYTKNSETEEWINEAFPITLLSFGNFNPNDTSYEITYEFLGGIEEGVKTSRIVPDGFQCGKEEENVLFRIIPSSLYTKLIEADEFYNRLPELYKNKENLDITFATMFSTLHDEPLLLDYTFNIAAIMKSDDEYMIFRISAISTTQVDGEDFTMTLKDQDGNSHTLAINVKDEEYELVTEDDIKLKLKLVDLAG